MNQLVHELVGPIQAITNSNIERAYKLDAHDKALRYHKDVNDQMNLLDSIK